jgi:DNA-binding beta-propeller fold protein YncE
VAFSPDGTRLASAGQDNAVRVWEAATGREALTLKGHTGSVSSVAFSPDGTRLASGGEDQTVRVWDTATGRVTLALPGHTLGVSSVAFSPDGTRLASASGDTVRVWDAATGRQARALQGHTGPVHSVAFSPDGSRLASAGYDGTVRLWEAATGREALTLRGHTAEGVYLIGGVYSVAFSPDGTRLASGGADRTVRVWDAAAGREALTLRLHTGWVLGVAFSPEGTRLVVRYADDSVNAWDLRTQQETPPPNPLPLPRFPGGGDVSPDSRFLARPLGEVVEVIDTRLSREELASRRALAAPDPARHAWEAAEAERTGQPFAVLFHLDRAGRAHAERGEWDQARAHFGGVTALRPQGLGGWRQLALAHLGAGRTDAYRETCGRLLVLGRRTSEAPLTAFLLNPAPGNAWGAALVLRAWQDAIPRRRQEQRLVVRPAVVRPDAVADPAQLLAFSTQADPVTRGAALCRTGRHDAAAKLLGPVQEGPGLLYLALAEHGRGRPAAAQEALQRAVGWLEAPSRDDPERSNYARLPWDERLEVDLLRREAEGLLNTGNRTVDRKE